MKYRKLLLLPLIGLAVSGLSMADPAASAPPPQTGKFACWNGKIVEAPTPCPPLPMKVTPKPDRPASDNPDVTTEDMPDIEPDDPTPTSFTCWDGRRVTSAAQCSPAQKTSTAKPVKKPAPPTLTVAPPMPMPNVAVANMSPATFDVVPAQGKALHFVGKIDSGATAALREALADNPGTRTLILSSPGGNLVEGMGMAQLVRTHRLDTHIETLCASACTFPFLTGAQRSLAPGALFGMHQSSVKNAFSLAPTNPEETRFVHDMMRRFYLNAGVPADITERALAIMPDDMWYPAHQALIEARIATRVAGPDEFPLEGRWETLADMENSVLVGPLWEATKKAKPRIYMQAASVGWIKGVLAKDEEDAGEAAQAVLEQLLMKDMPQYAPDLIDSFITQQHRIWTDPKRKTNSNCSYLKSRFPLFADKEHDDYQQQEALLIRMAENPTQEIHRDKDATYSLIVDLTQFWAVVLADSGKVVGDASRGFCREPGRFYKALMTLPVEDRRKFLGVLATAESGTIADSL